jgi:Zn-dependent protease
VSGPYPRYQYSYTVGPRVSAQRPISTSPTELRHLAIAALVLTLDFVILFVLHSRFVVNSLASESAIVATSAGAALTAFVAHELAHKVSAQRRGYWAEFRMAPLGLVMSFVTAVIGFLFAAPGATMIGGMSTPSDWGRTSLAGPLTNFAFGLLFLASALAVAAVYPSDVLFSKLLLFLAFINGWFGAFNLIPIGPLDGAKVYRWSKSVWAVSFVVMAALAVYLYYLFFIV